MKSEGIGLNCLGGNWSEIFYGYRGVIPLSNKNFSMKYEFQKIQFEFLRTTTVFFPRNENENSGKKEM